MYTFFTVARMYVYLLSYNTLLLDLLYTYSCRPLRDYGGVRK